MPAQARHLVTEITSDFSINVAEDWKMVTLFIGGNNLRSFCQDWVRIEIVFITISKYMISEIDNSQYLRMTMVIC